MAVDTDRLGVVIAADALPVLRVLVGVLAGLLALALLVAGVIAVIAELKGTWHWAIHLETTISYIGLFVSWVLAALVPAFLALVIGRRVIGDG